MAWWPSARKKKRAYSAALETSGTNSGIVGPPVKLEDLLNLGVVVHVDVRRQDVDRRRRRLPQGQHVVGGTTALVAAGRSRGDGIAERGVRIKRQRILRLSCRGDLADVAGHGPGMEVLVGVVAEHLFPAGGRGAGLLVHRGQHVGRHRAVEGLLRRRPVVTDGAPGARFVLDLHHDDGVLRVDRLQVAHQRDEGALVGFEHLPRERRRRVDRPPVRADHPSGRIDLRILLDPQRHIVRTAILPGREPEQDQADVVLAALVDESIHHRVIEHPGPRLELFPVDRHFNGVGVEGFDGRPDLRHHAWPRAGIVDLRPQDQKRRTVDQQGVASLLVHQPRQGRGGRPGVCARGQSKQTTNQQRESACSREGPSTICTTGGRQR